LYFDSTRVPVTTSPIWHRVSDPIDRFVDGLSLPLSRSPVSRYGFRVCDIASLARKHHSSVTRWNNKGLQRESDDPEFSKRLNDLDAAISGES
jgi:hypothetical protein